MRIINPYFNRKIPYLRTDFKNKEERDLADIAEEMGVAKSNIAKAWKTGQAKFLENWAWYRALTACGFTHEEIVFVLRDYQKQDPYRRRILRKKLDPLVLPEDRLTKEMLLEYENNENPLGEYPYDSIMLKHFRAPKEGFWMEPYIADWSR